MALIGACGSLYSTNNGCNRIIITIQLSLTQSQMQRDIKLRHLQQTFNATRTAYRPNTPLIPIAYACFILDRIDSTVHQHVVECSDRFF
jgi:hypothetical protein